ncbi:MAG: hypothetical protein A2626_02785 [Candidatus Nealsonbacteria bacterium RIFCSPHIGHO2_01_FULL_38_55]|uniref:Zinc finger CHC2-type domain-containing protein n=1 Tax=Candidatus Nealsonbacteria bacterium RIFCSPHIGHO2_01_FULL_38_55 TaxID=1801664 RepID=A0A1G2E1K4_9BACT|nr:MAG: primase protein [Parcubacteria group bacterium GW2011_GWA2_38_27]OGZ19635.1 MAG: hypothetical protein A2626_02785 [Candidatus Nealsonbacteria bacterium RIFCSPHIGHO2_01_FULL_38_55]OGZ21905.1 MAG: hypothetical protein A3C48_00085 [Candidatus Nealsonbacteria bacterium RIFCSPHIGHO2_02_FULL_38_75]OGZ22721.1 MAG: hypothetical protein A2981_01430 [Candidatus Nealsonbacteria bacterium RIFCSPLOWO2_01_FULL_38_120]OGZ26274.1 MAG: hypothetical protein A3I85_01270 [Candidatus Nealsonbacteria bacteri
MEILQSEIDELEEEALSKNKYSDNELLEIFPEAIPCLKRKLGFLKMEVKAREFEVLKLLSRIYSRTLQNSFAQWFYLEVVKVLRCEDIDDSKKEISKLKFLLFPPKEIKGKITPTEIQRAKDRDFHDLLEFNRQGFAFCPFHQEKTKSFHLYKNKCKCFGCGKSVDTIQFIMETKGLTFPEAVMELSK